MSLLQGLENVNGTSWRNGNLVSELFNKKTVSKQSQKVEITSAQVDNAQEWLDMLNQGVLVETEHYYDFRDIVLQGILGYDKKRIKEHNDNMEYQVTDDGGNKVLVIEAKGSDKDLYKKQHYGRNSQETPILQTWTYMGLGRKYGICTNYNKFILLTIVGGYERQHVFDFKSIKKDNEKINEEKLKEFIHVFSMKTLIDGQSSEKLREESKSEQRDFTEKFYNLYHDTRVRMINAFENNDNVDRGKAIYYTQIMLNRLIFIFFVADRGVLRDQSLFEDTLNKIINSGEFSEQSHRIHDRLKELFRQFDKGSRIDGISKFNGSLFSSPFPDMISFPDIVEEPPKQSSSKLPKQGEKVKNIMQKEPKLNPIITNLLTMDQYDFKTEVDVDILGHIFEQSLSDIEILKLENLENTRKNEGVYYTPDYITNYICKNTIVPYLSKSKSNSIQKLLGEYDGNLDELKEKIRKLRILDPACGSGAFLIQAVDMLMIISRAIHNTIGDNSNEQQQLDQNWEDDAIRQIITENIYGVDLNRESADITKLSLFLKMVTNEHPLIDLSTNIKTGNSVITDISKPNAFDWNKNFPSIMESGGFDIIIGNPPYVRYQSLESYIDYIQLPKSNTLVLEKDFKIHSYTDLVGYFFYHSLNILKQNGKLGFISSDGWMHSNYGKSLQKVILDNCVIEKMMHTVFNVFEDADIKTITILLEKKKSSTNTNVQLINVNEEDEITSGDFKNIIKPQSEFEQGNWNLYFAEDEFIPKIDMIKIHPDIGHVKIGKLTGCDSFFVLSKEIIDKYQIPDTYLKPILSKNIDSAYVVPKQATEYFFNVDESKGKLLQSEDGKKALKYIEMGEKTTITPKMGSDRTPKLIPELYNLKNKKTWYSLSLGIAPPIFIARFGDKQMKLVENSGDFHSTRRNIGITPKKTKYTYALLSYLRSSFFALYLEKHGHIHGGGVLEIRTTDYRNALVPDLDKISKINVEKMKKAWERYKEDLDQKKLDDVVFKVLGFTSNEKEQIEVKLEEIRNNRLNSKKN